MYLASESNLDAQTALQKGFKAENLVAVERDAEKVKSLRKRGIQCICGDIFEVATAWGRRIDVLNLDFCCGLEKSVTSGLLLSAVHPGTRRAVFAVNLQRGREKGMGEVMSAFQFMRPDSNKPKHRGVLAFDIANSGTYFPMCEYLRDSGVPEARIDQITNEVMSNQSLALNSYRSTTGALHMDTAVFVGPCRGLEKFHGRCTETSFSKDTDAEILRLTSKAPVIRKIAAFRAHQTMRGRGCTGSK